ncbi:hypothetical protein JCM3765_002131 [Sporobolomyces pararoseus]
MSECLWKDHWASESCSKIVTPKKVSNAPPSPAALTEAMIQHVEQTHFRLPHKERYQCCWNRCSNRSKTKTMALEHLRSTHFEAFYADIAPQATSLPLTSSKEAPSQTNSHCSDVEMDSPQLGTLDSPFGASSSSSEPCFSSAHSSVSRPATSSTPSSRPATSSTSLSPSVEISSSLSLSQAQTDGSFSLPFPPPPPPSVPLQGRRKAEKQPRIATRRSTRLRKPQEDENNDDTTSAAVTTSSSRRTGQHKVMPSQLKPLPVARSPPTYPVPVSKGFYE